MIFASSSGLSARLITGNDLERHTLSIEEFRKQVERSKEHLDLVLFSVGVLSTYQNVWKPKYENAKSGEERELLLRDLALIKAKLKIIDEVEADLFPEHAAWFRQWKKERKAEGKLE